MLMLEKRALIFHQSQVTASKEPTPSLCKFLEHDLVLLPAGDEI